MDSVFLKGILSHGAMESINWGPKEVRVHFKCAIHTHADPAKCDSALDKFYLDQTENQFTSENRRGNIRFLNIITPFYM